MKLSFITLNRILEDEAEKDSSVRRKLKEQGRSLLCDVRPLSDDEILARLSALNVPMDQARFVALTKPFLSAEDAARAVYRTVKPPLVGANQDWVWLAFTCLWERWQPERPSVETIDDWMQEGYRCQEKHDWHAACGPWLRTWAAIRNLVESQGIRSLEELDARVPLTQSVGNWVSDFLMELGNAGRDDPSFLKNRLEVAQTLLDRFAPEESLRRNCQRDLAETYFALGQAEQGDQLFRQWLQEDPRWGWGWIGWSDCYFLCAEERDKDASRAEQILKQGLAVAGVEDRPDLLDRLADIYSETGRPQEAEAVKKEIDKLKSSRSVRPAPVAPPAVRQPAAPKPVQFPLAGRPPNLSSGLVRVGRNDPCPCGSGKKFKKCCGVPGT
jgi:tetratricopeptide (TPR) repeat protein